MSTKKIIIDDNSNPKYKDGWLDHVYVVHIVAKDGKLKYSLFNDKGDYLDYNANRNTITEQIAKPLIDKEGYLCITAYINKDEYEKYVNPYSFVDDAEDTDGFTVINRENVELDVKRKDATADNKIENYTDNDVDDFFLDF